MSSWLVISRFRSFQSVHAISRHTFAMTLIKIPLLAAYNETQEQRSTTILSLLVQETMKTSSKSTVFAI